MSAQYPSDLAKLVAARLCKRYGSSPSLGVLTHLLETLYFASFQTYEGRPVICTLNYIAPDSAALALPCRSHAAQPIHVPFEQPLPLSIRTLTKLARAADPAVSSFAVFSNDKDDLFLWGMLDQEPRYIDFMPLDSTVPERRPGQIQATIRGIGNISVFDEYSLIGSLTQDTVIHEYHDILWQGPVHDLLTNYLTSVLPDRDEARMPTHQCSAELEHLDKASLRWTNALCRILACIRQYRHGGGILFVPYMPQPGLNIPHRIKYERLLSSLLGMVRNEPGQTHSSVWLDEQRQEVLNAVRFIASLSCIDGVVVLDKRMVVHGFGVEIRTGSSLGKVSVAGDSLATPELMREVGLTNFGTRHRAMMRYCFDMEGTLGFVVSQDGAIRAMTRLADRLVLWENIDVRLAFQSEQKAVRHGQQAPMLLRFHTGVA